MLKGLMMIVTFALLVLVSTSSVQPAQAGSFARTKCGPGTDWGRYSWFPGQKRWSLWGSLRGKCFVVRPARRA